MLFSACNLSHFEWLDSLMWQLKCWLHSSHKDLPGSEQVPL